YEVNNTYRAELEKKTGILFSGTSPDGKLVEYVEYPRDIHPYLVATQAHPELRSRPTRPHPLFAGLVKAAVSHATGVPASSRRSEGEARASDRAWRAAGADRPPGSA
ncbi:CTP synthase, partial [Streptomyces sp. NPDC047017]